MLPTSSLPVVGNLLSSLTAGQASMLGNLLGGMPAAGIPAIGNLISASRWLSCRSSAPCSPPSAAWPSPW